MPRGIARTPDEKIESLIKAYGYENVSVTKEDKEQYCLSTANRWIPDPLRDFVCAHYYPFFESSQVIRFKEFKDGVD